MQAYSLRLGGCLPRGFWKNRVQLFERKDEFHANMNYYVIPFALIGSASSELDLLAWRWTYVYPVAGINSFVAVKENK